MMSPSIWDKDRELEIFRKWHENHLKHTTESEKQAQGRRNKESMMTRTAHNTFWSLFLTVDLHKLLLSRKSVGVDTD